MTEFEQVVAGVTDEQAGLPPPNSPEEVARKQGLVAKAIERLNEVVEQLGSIERALGQSLPDVVKDAPLGDAVDLVSDLHVVINKLTNDASGGGAVEKVKARLKYVKEVTMPERFAEQNITSFSTERFRVTKSLRVMASIHPGQQEQAFEWLRNNDLGGLIKPTVNASSLSATAKEFLESGRELPEDLFRAHYQPGTSVTAKRK